MTLYKIYAKLFLQKIDMNEIIIKRGFINA